ncbi:MAG: hypothetical protein ACOY3X_09475 [Pseudomonadota bacterium]
MIWLAGVILAFMAVPFLVGPVLVLMQQRLPARYRFEKRESRTFLAEQTPTFLALHHALLQKGFNPAGASVLQMRHVKTDFSLYLDEQAGVICTLSTAASSLGVSTQAEFTQMYSDGSLVNVNNHPVINVYPRNPRREAYRFPELNDLDALLAAAMKIFAARGSGRQVSRYPLDEVWLAMEVWLDAELDALIAGGYVSETVQDGQRRLTVKGAILMTWKLCWPVKPVLARIDRASARQALARAG